MFSTTRTAAPNRKGYAVDDIELCLPEFGVMLAFATHVLSKSARPQRLLIHPDGMHARDFPIVQRLRDLGFQKKTSMGKTHYAGEYFDGRHCIVVNPKSGLGDIVGEIGGAAFVAECKGGAVNTTAPGQVSKLRKGLCEAVGQLLALPQDGRKHFAIVPFTKVTERLAMTMKQRCLGAGIEIVLVADDGAIHYI